MKGSGFYFVIAFLLVFLFIDGYGGATEGDPNGIPGSTQEKDPTTNLNGKRLAPPDVLKGNEEKKAEDQDGRSQEKNKNGSDNSDLNDKPIGNKDKPAAETQPEDGPSEKKDEPSPPSKPQDTPSDKLDEPSVESNLDDSPSKDKNKHAMESKPVDDKGKGKLDEGLDSRILPGGCDPSNMCIDQKNRFIACLRVPGQDSLALSLLIQNKGKGSLTVKIDAPDFVTLMETTVQVQADKDEEVKFSVKDGANDTWIDLKAGEGQCRLNSVKDGANDTWIDLKAGEGQCRLNLCNMMLDSNKKSEIATLSGYTGLFTHTSATYMLLAAAVLVGAIYLCLRFRRKQQQEGGLRYEKVEMLLPVSSGGKKERDEADGWDNSWGDGWDDEEAPVTPLKPASTPSSKGLASRRFHKDARRD